MLAAFACRLLAAMINLALLLAAHGATGSYSIAGVTAAAYTVAFSFAYPFWGRVGSRKGFRRALALAALLQSGAFALFVALAAAKAPAVTLVLSAALAGACVPPAGAVANTVFTSVPQTAEVRQAAFALSSMLTETVFIVGPLIVAGVVVVLPAYSAVAVTAVLAGGGALWLSVTEPVRHLDRSRVATWRRAGLFQGQGWRQLQIMAVAALCALSLGALDVTIVAHAGELRASAGLLLALAAFGGVGGSLVYSAATLPGTLRGQLAAVLIFFGAVAAPLIAEPGIVVTVIALLLIGVADGPADALINSVAGTECEPDARAQLFTLLIPAGWLGYGIGTAATGYAIQRGSAGTGAILIVCGAVAGALVCLSGMALRFRPQPDAGTAAGTEVRDVLLPSPPDNTSSGTPAGSKPRT
jgi:MFS family permease